MNIYIENHEFVYETENIVRMFFPNEKLPIIKEYTAQKEKPCVVTTVTYLPDGNTLLCTGVLIGDFEKYSEEKLTAGESDEKTQERMLAVCLYRLLCDYSGRSQPWGILTGVRPIKLFRKLREEYGEKYAKDYFTEKLLVSSQKTEMSAITEKNERRIIELSRPDSFSLYISIPFCPSRCSYCSFVSQTIESAKKLISPYFDLLLKEIEYTSEIVRKNGLRLESVYVGGGTPTTLDPDKLFRLISKVMACFDMSTCREFTIEAGRPDTIDEDKLSAILNGGVDRISINPQTLNDNVLQVIGRKHTSEQFISAFKLARDLGFSHINTDLIAGLPADTPESFRYTIEKICEMDPESITVHTLAMKRSSRLNISGVETGGSGYAGQMLDFAQKKLFFCGYIPYYLYRQTRMEGNLENVGWSKPGYEGIYNIYVMDETHTVIGCGAGAVTKLRDPGSTELIRIFNYKYPYEYISGFEEMLKRKNGVVEFYDKLS